MGADPHRRPVPYTPEPHPGLSVRATHRVLTDGHSVLYALTEDAALEQARARLPRPSTIEIHHRCPRTAVETWELWRCVVD